MPTPALIPRALLLDTLAHIILQEYRETMRKEPSDVSSADRAARRTLPPAEPR